MKSPDLINAESRNGPKSQICSICPLNEVQAGTTVRIHHLSASAETSQRLREIGFFEQQVIRLLARHGNIICQIQNCRMGIGAKLAEAILVERVSSPS